MSGSPRHSKRLSKVNKRVLKELRASYGMPVSPAMPVRGGKIGRSGRLPKSEGGLQWTYGLKEMVEDQAKAVLDAALEEEKGAQGTIFDQVKPMPHLTPQV